MSSLTSQIYKAARLSATASAVLSGKPSRIAKRGAHIVPECVYWEPQRLAGLCHDLSATGLLASRVGRLTFWASVVIEIEPGVLVDRADATVDELRRAAAIQREG